MFDHFTERARYVLVLAQDEARSFRHPHIGTEHLLLGVMREQEGAGARVLDSLDITIEEVRADVARVLGPGHEIADGQMPFTPRAKHALQVALSESLALGTNHVATEHILLGLVADDESVAARVLRQYDGDPETIRNETIRLVSRPRRDRSGGGERAPVTVAVRCPVCSASMESISAGQGITEDVTRCTCPACGAAWHLRLSIELRRDPGEHA